MTLLKLLNLITAILICLNNTDGQHSISLDGTWEILFDEKNSGREDNWMKAEVFGKQPGIRLIEVPRAWETIQKDYEGVAFYRKRFIVPKHWDEKVIRIKFGAVNYLTEIWLNDEVVGYHEGGFTPFEFRVDEMVRVGEENLLTLRVVGPLFLSNKEVDGIKALEMPTWRGGITGGIWQSVSLEATDHFYVKEVFVEPNIENNTVQLHLLVDYTGMKNTGAKLIVKIIEKGKSNVIVDYENIWSLHPGENRQTLTLDIPKAKYWSPDHPNLYLAKVAMSDAGIESNEWSGQFGIRELTIKEKDFYLNGERIFIKAAFFEGLYPNGICAPDNEAMARKEIQLAKEAGFNMIRPWRHPPTPMWLDLADEMGVMVVGSPALECMQLPISTPYLPSRVENEVKQMILRDRNRACIVQWELFNELHRPVLKQLMHPMANLVRDLDPTRLILDESGGWAFGANMYLPHRYEPTKFNDIHNYPGPFINREKYDGYLSIGMTDEEKEKNGLVVKTPGRNVVPGLMSYVSELGYGSLPDLTKNNLRFQKEGNALTSAFRYHARLANEQEQMLKASGFGHFFPEMQAFYLAQQYLHGTANKRMIEAVRSNPEVDGYCIHALVAGDWILGAGLLDLWREPKTYAYHATKAANQPRIISIRSEARNVYAEKEPTLTITGINDLVNLKGEIEIIITEESGKEIYSKKEAILWASGVHPLATLKLPTKNWQGNYLIQGLVYNEEGQIVTQNEYRIDVFPEETLKLGAVNLALIGQHERLEDYLRKNEVSLTSFSDSLPLSFPVLVLRMPNRKEAEQLQSFTARGGKVVYLAGYQKSSTGHIGNFPFQAKVVPARGLWTCIPHLVHDHPIFKGLPSKMAMSDIYQNVWARETLVDLQTSEDQLIQTVVGTVAFEWFSKDHKLHYTGPGASWWGGDVVIFSSGKGECIVSQLHLLPNLGKDPVADKILKNLIEFLKI